MADVSSVLGTRLPGMNAIVSRVNATSEVSVWILESLSSSGMRAEVILRAVQDLPPDVSSRIGKQVVFTLAPAVVYTTVSAPPPPPRPPHLPPRSPPSEGLELPTTPLSPADLSATTVALTRAGVEGANLQFIFGVAAALIASALLIALTICYYRRHETHAEQLSQAGNAIEIRVDVATPVKTGDQLQCDDTPAIGREYERDLLKELHQCRESMERHASAAENRPRLRLRQLEVQRAEALMMAWQNRGRSDLSQRAAHDLIDAHDLGTFDPDSFANRALVAQQASVSAQAARRRARARLGGSEVQADISLDPITGVIQRASVTGGRLHARDLASQLTRTETEYDGECDPDQWLASAMKTHSHRPVEPSASPAAKDRLSRAREARKSTDGDAPEEMRYSYNFDVSVSSPSTPSKPRSLAEIRSASQGRLPPNASCTTPVRLDPLTDALHTASMLGVAPPPPPNDWRRDGPPSQDAAERVRRARSDQEARKSALGNTPKKQTSGGVSPVSSPAVRTLELSIDLRCLDAEDVVLTDTSPRTPTPSSSSTGSATGGVQRPERLILGGSLPDSPESGG